MKMDAAKGKWRFRKPHAVVPARRESRDAAHRLRSCPMPFLDSGLRRKDGGGVVPPFSFLAWPCKAAPVIPAKAGIQRRCPSVAFLSHAVSGFRPSPERRVGIVPLISFPLRGLASPSSFLCTALQGRPRHSREGGNPETLPIGCVSVPCRFWIPAFAGKTGRGCSALFIPFARPCKSVLVPFARPCKAILIPFAWPCKSIRLDG